MANISKYRRHPDSLELLQIPKEIRSEYLKVGYTYFVTEDGNEYPVPEMIAIKPTHVKIEPTELIWQAYIEGFLNGYNELTDNSIEQISFEFKKGFRSFTVNLTDDGKQYFKPENIEEAGYREGKRYKAWKFVFDSPYTYIGLFTKTPATITPEAPAPATETKEDKIRRILEPLRGAFDDSGHLDLIIKALAEYNTIGAPSEYRCRQILLDNKAFYKPFFEVNKETKIPFKVIAEVLHMFIYSNNRSMSAIQVNSILQNFKRKEYKSN